MNSRNGRTALRYAELGWAVLPLEPGAKRPARALATRGVYDATTDQGQIRRWWKRLPTAGVGIATGGDVGLVVIDADGPTGLESAAALNLPRTVEVRTLRGVHWYYRSDTVRRSSSGKLGPKIDVQVNGAYVVAPPTEIGGKRYRWRRSAFHQALTPLPPNLTALLIAPHRGTVSLPGLGQKGRETVPGRGDQSRSGLDAQLAIRLILRGATKDAVRAAFVDRSRKYIERQERASSAAAERYFESVYGWALRFADTNRRQVTVTSVLLEVLGATPRRPALGRVILRLVALDDDSVFEVRVAVPNGVGRGDEMWRAVAPDIDPGAVLGSDGVALIAGLEGRVFTVVIRDSRVVWMRRDETSMESPQSV